MYVFVHILCVKVEVPNFVSFRDPKVVGRVLYPDDRCGNTKGRVVEGSGKKGLDWW